MSSTYTESSTSTFTEARARAVMKKVLADLVGLANAGHLAATTPAKWHEDLTFAMERDAVRCFQIQLTTPNGTKFALEYEVSWDGTLFEDSSSGGIDWLEGELDDAVPD